MPLLDPDAIFDRLARDIPEHLHSHVYVAGSLAAAYHHRLVLRKGVNTKDADLVVHPAGDSGSCQAMAMDLLRLGWRRRTGDCYPSASPAHPGQLRAVRLYPPDSQEYFVELLGLPEKKQEEAKGWQPIQLNDGWYGTPCFRFMSLTSLGLSVSVSGIQYASTSMMALANLLSHPEISGDRIQSGAFSGMLRSAKDLGRVVTLAYLAGRSETYSWVGLWTTALVECFPSRYAELMSRCGSGLKALLSSSQAMEDALSMSSNGLLSGLGVTDEIFSATCTRLLADVIRPVEEKR